MHAVLFPVVTHPRGHPMTTRIAATTLALAFVQPIAMALAQANPPAAPGGSAATPPTPAQLGMARTGMMMGDMRRTMP